MELNRKVFNLIYFLMACISLFISCYILNYISTLLAFFIFCIVTLVSFGYLIKYQRKRIMNSDIIISVVLVFLFLVFSGIFSNIFQMKQISLSTVFISSSLLVFNLIYLISGKIKSRTAKKVLLFIGILYSSLLFILSVINIFVPIIQVR